MNLTDDLDYPNEYASDARVNQALWFAANAKSVAPKAATTYQKTAAIANLSGLGYMGYMGATGGGVAKGAASGAATGATLGSIIPGLGTVIGGAVGAVVGIVSSVFGGKKPVRPSANQVANCKNMLVQYNQVAAQSPTLSSGAAFGEQALKDLNWCLMALYGNDIKNKDPRFFDGNFTDLMKIGTDIVAQVFRTPAGSMVNLSGTSNKIGKQTFSSPAQSFVNPPFISLYKLANDVFYPIAIAYCQATASKGAPGCQQLYSRPEYKRLLFDILGLIASRDIPQVSEAQLQAMQAQATANLATTTAATLPTVATVATQPVVSAALPITQAPASIPVASVPLTIAPSQTAVDTATNNLSAASGLTASQSDALAAALAQLQASGASQSQALSSALQSLAASGVNVTPAVQQAAAQTVAATDTPSTAGIGSVPIWVWGLGAAGLFFAFAMPQRGQSRGAGMGSFGKSLQRKRNPRRSRR